MRFENALFHSSVMFDKIKIQSVGGYDESLLCLVDFDLYVRVANYFKIANVGVRLSLKRVHESQFFAGRGGAHFKPEAEHAAKVIRGRIALLRGAQ
jgi:hypothetical protein